MLSNIPRILRKGLGGPLADEESGKDRPRSDEQADHADADEYS
ncbi:hypothetical protein MASR2M79_09850 [Aminivibrio sp.]